MEVCWVALIALYGFLAVDLGDATFIFWALVWAFVSGVELCLSVFGFILMAEVRGTAV